jgi:hypothetical protein
MAEKQTNISKVLCLHGWHGTAQILKQQIAPLAATLPSEVELVFVDAPSLSSGSFGWWQEGFRGWERTRDWAVDLLSHEHFDGIFGFSQGAALAGLLAAVRESDTSTSLNFEFAVMISGFTSDAPQHVDLFKHKLKIPSLHTMSQVDGIVPMSDSVLLADRFEDPVILEHRGGHVIPSDPMIAARIAEFMTSHGQITNASGAPNA